MLISFMLIKKKSVSILIEREIEITEESLS